MAAEESAEDLVDLARRVRLKGYTGAHQENASADAPDPNDPQGLLAHAKSVGTDLLALAKNVELRGYKTASPADAPNPNSPEALVTLAQSVGLSGYSAKER